MKKSRVKSAPAPTVTLDEVREHARHVTALAELLEHCGQVDLAEPMESRLVAEAGGLIAAENRAVEAFLQELEAHGGV